MTLNVEWLLVPDRLIYLGFSLTTVSRVYREWSKKIKYPVSGSCVDENALLMSEENGQTSQR